MRIDQNKENAMTFRDFMEGVRNEDSPVGDLANDAIGDEKFPWQEAERENGNLESNDLSQHVHCVFSVTTIVMVVAIPLFAFLLFAPVPVVLGAFFVFMIVLMLVL